MAHTVYSKLPQSIEFSDANLTMLGLITRLQAFHEAAAREIAADNPFSSAALLRSLAEVVALVCYLIEKPSELRRVSIRADNKDRFKMGTLIEAGAREAPAFKEIYAQLSNLAHPSYAGANSSMTISNDGHFTWQSQPTFKDDDEACVMYLWLLELTEAAGLLWCKLYDMVPNKLTT